MWTTRLGGACISASQVSWRQPSLQPMLPGNLTASCLLWPCPPGFLPGPLLPQSSQECQRALGLSQGCQTSRGALEGRAPAGSLGSQQERVQERGARALGSVPEGSRQFLKGSPESGESAGGASTKLLEFLLKRAPPQERGAQNSQGPVRAKMLKTILGDWRQL